MRGTKFLAFIACAAIALSVGGACGGDDGADDGTGGSGGVGGSGGSGGTGGTGGTGGSGGSGGSGGTGGFGGSGGSGGSGGVGGSGGDGGSGGTGGDGGSGGSGGAGGGAGAGGSGGEGGAGGAGGEGGTGPVAQAEARFLNLVPGSPLTVNREGTVLAASLDPWEASGWIDLDAGRHTFVLSGGGGSTLVSRTADLSPDRAHTLVPWQSTTGLELANLLLPDAAIPAGEARLQVFHGATTLSTGRITVLEATDSLATSALASAIATGETQLAQVAAAELRFAVDVERDGIGDHFFRTPPLTAGADYVLAVVKDPALSYPWLVLLDEAGQATRLDPVQPPFAWLRYVNANPWYPPASGGVDFHAQGTVPTVSSLPAGIGTGRIPIISRHQPIDVAPAGQPRSAAVAGVTYGFAESGRYEVIFWGDANPGTLSVVEPPDTTGIPAGQVRLQLFYGVKGFPAADVYVGGVRRVDDLTEGNVSAPFEVAAGTSTTLGIDLTQDGTPEFTFALPALQDGAAYTIAGAADDTLPYLLLLPADDAGGVQRIDPTL